MTSKNERDSKPH